MYGISNWSGLVLDLDLQKPEGGIYAGNQAETCQLSNTASERFAKLYSKYHGCLAVGVCLLGIGSHCFFCKIIRHPSLQTPTNSLLLLIAACDSGLLILYLFHTVRFYMLDDPQCTSTTYGWTWFKILYANLAMCIYGCSVYYTVTLGVYRGYTIRCMDVELPCGRRTLTITAGVVVVFVLFFCLPHFCSMAVVRWPRGVDGCGYQFRVGFSDLATRHAWLVEAAFWVNGIGFKAIPSLILCFIIVYLLTKLKRLRSRGLKLRKLRARACMSTTVSLISILSMFIVTQLPQAMLHVFSAGMLGPHFTCGLYQDLGDLMDLWSVMNNVLSFPLYCLTNTVIRRRIRQVMPFFQQKPPRHCLSITTVARTSSLVQGESTALSYDCRNSSLAHVL